MEASKTYDLMVAGSVCCDLIFSGVDAVPAYGTEMWANNLKITVGGVFNVASAASRLGLQVALPCILGTDVFSQIIRKAILKEGVCADFVREVDKHFDQVSVVLNYGFERAFVSYAEKGGYDLMADALRIVCEHRVRALVVCPTEDERVLELMQTARERGSIVLMDCFWNEKLMQSELLKRQLALADYFLPNAMEASAVSGEEMLVKAAEKLARLTPQPVIKNGRHGVLWPEGGAIRDMDAVHLGKTVDTTGAGDNLMAGFAYGLLHGYPLEKSLRCGVICGAKKVLTLSGYEGSIYQEELERLLAKLERGEPLTVETEN